MARLASSSSEYLAFIVHAEEGHVLTVMDDISGDDCTGESIFIGGNVANLGLASDIISSFECSGP